jgi:hypothetical protein
MLKISPKKSQITKRLVKENIELSKFIEVKISKFQNVKINSLFDKYVSKGEFTLVVKDSSNKSPNIKLVI